MDATGSGEAVAISDFALARCIVNRRKGKVQRNSSVWRKGGRGKERGKKKKQSKPMYPEIDGVC